MKWPPEGTDRMLEHVYCDREGNVYLDVVGHLRSPRGQAQLAGVRRIREAIQRKNLRQKAKE